MNHHLSVVNDQLTKFRDYLQNELIFSPLTVRAYLDDVALFAQFLGDQTPIEACTVNDVRAFVMMMIERGDSARSVNRRISSLRRFYNYLIRSAVIEINPTASIHTIKQPTRLPHFVGETKIDAIVERLSQQIESDIFSEVRDATITLTLYYTGMRRAEIASLKVESLDFGRMCINVSGKGGKERLLPIAEQLTPILERYLCKRAEFCCESEQKSLFLKDKTTRKTKVEDKTKTKTKAETKAITKTKSSDENLVGNHNQIKPITGDDIYRIVNRTLCAEGVEARQSPHTLRHTFATHLLSADAPIRSIQELLGHSSIASTQIYTHNTISSLKESFSKNHPRAKK